MQLLRCCTAILSCLLLVDYSVAFNSCVNSVLRKRGSFHWGCWFCCFRFLLFVSVFFFPVVVVGVFVYCMYNICMCVYVECLRFMCVQIYTCLCRLLMKFRLHTLEWLHISLFGCVARPSGVFFSFCLYFCSDSLVLAAAAAVYKIKEFK